MNQNIWAFVGVVVFLLVGTVAWFVYCYHHSKLTLKASPPGSTDITELWKVLGSTRLVSIRTLAIYRTIAALFGWYLILHGIFYDGFYRFRNFTVWNWCLLILYFTLNSLLTWYNYFQSNAIDCNCLSYLFNPKKNENNQNANIFQIYYPFITWILYQINCANVIFIDVIVWCLLYPFATNEQRTELLLTWFSLHMHITNLILVYIDLFLNQIPTNFHFAVFEMVLLLVYIGYQFLWVHHFSYDFSYPFLETSQLYNIGFYFGMVFVNLFFWQCSVWITQYRNIKLPLAIASPNNSRQTSIEIIDNQTDFYYNNNNNNGINNQNGVDVTGLTNLQIPSKMDDIKIPKNMTQIAAALVDSRSFTNSPMATPHARTP